MSVMCRTYRWIEVRRRQAHLLQTSLEAPEQAVSMLEDSLSVYEAFGHTRSSAECCFQLAELLLRDSASYQPAYNMALRCHALLKELHDEAESHPYDHDQTHLSMVLASWVQLGQCANVLADNYRAIEYYKHAWSLIKDKHKKAPEAVEQMEDISRILLQLKLQSLSPEERLVHKV
jgi:hypothetical protein